MSAAPGRVPVRAWLVLLLVALTVLGVVAAPAAARPVPPTQACEGKQSTRNPRCPTPTTAPAPATSIPRTVARPPVTTVPARPSRPPVATRARPTTRQAPSFPVVASIPPLRQAPMQSASARPGEQTVPVTTTGAPTPAATEPAPGASSIPRSGRRAAQIPPPAGPNLFLLGPVIMLLMLGVVALVRRAGHRGPTPPRHVR